MNMNRTCTTKICYVLQNFRYLSPILFFFLQEKMPTRQVSAGFMDRLREANRKGLRGPETQEFILNGSRKPPDGNSDKLPSQVIQEMRDQGTVDQL